MGILKPTFRNGTKYTQILKKKIHTDVEIIVVVKWDRPILSPTNMDMNVNLLKMGPNVPLDPNFATPHCTVLKSTHFPS